MSSLAVAPTIQANVLSAPPPLAQQQQQTAPPKKVLCTCTYKCAPGKLVAPSTRFAHRKREKRAEDVQKAAEVKDGRETVSANIYTYPSAGAAPQAQTTQSQSQKPGGVTALPTSTTVTSQPAMTTTAASQMAQAPAGAAPSAPSSSRFLTVPAIPNPNTPTAGFFKQQKLGTASAFRAGLSVCPPPGLENVRAGEAGDVVEGGREHGTRDRSASSSSATATNLPTRSLTEMHMRTNAISNPAQVTAPAYGTKRTTFSSYLPPPQPARASIRPPIPFPSHITHQNHQNSNFNSFYSQNPSFAVPPNYPSSSPVPFPDSGPLSLSNKARIEAWALNTARYAAAEEAELANVRACLYEARAQIEELASRSIEEKQTMEIELQRMEAKIESYKVETESYKAEADRYKAEAEKYKAQAERTDIWNAIRRFAKTHGRDALPVHFRKLYDCPDSEKTRYYQLLLDRLILGDLGVVESMARNVPPPVVSPLHTSTKRTASRVGTPLKREEDETFGGKPMDICMDEPSTPTRNVRGDYQSLRWHSDKRRRYNPPS
ncbi:hypothetical protein SCHPADRAFT_938032 [Schizopora paradoxa]|uniref:Uncharacterized protein n=1 Tax=Schizopora paradoxa TaxID=27342 RepID=A0A0H2S3C9_9AGAM|nr:hypothetical protein SCHPADRAFT_938032 [Schizopora paradoxa]